MNKLLLFTLSFVLLTAQTLGADDSMQLLEENTPSAGPSTSPQEQQEEEEKGRRPAAAASKDVLKTLEIRAVDLAYQPNALTVAKPGRYIVKLLNTGQMPHDIIFPDGAKISAAAGATAVGEVEVPEDGIGFICSVPGHFHAGMKGEIRVAGTRAVKDSGPAAGTVVEPGPKALPYKLYDARAPEPLRGSKVHDIDLVIEEKLMTVAPGYVQKVWAFGGKVPGPVIRVKQGDTVRVHLKNPASNEMAHSIDFHSSQAAWNDEMTSIETRQRKTLRVAGGLCRGLDVPLRQPPSLASHGQWPVWDGDR